MRSGCQSLTIAGTLPAFNDVIRESKAHFANYSKDKKRHTHKIAWLCRSQRLQPFEERSQFLFIWHAPDKRKDPDNIAFAKKYILDGFVAAGLMKDGWSGVGGLADDFHVDRANPRILVVILPAQPSLFEKLYHTIQER